MFTRAVTPRRLFAGSRPIENTALTPKKTSTTNHRRNGQAIGVPGNFIFGNNVNDKIDILITRHHKKPGVQPHHPYSRVIAVPIIFDDVRRKLRECREYYEYKRRCVYCDIIRQEVADEVRLVRLTSHFAVVVPYAARAAYEALPEDDPKVRQPDISRAKKILGWEPKVKLDDGLGMSLEYFRQAVSSDHASRTLVR